MLHMTAKKGYLALDSSECREFGRSLADQYRDAKPFPHIVIDDFLDLGVLHKVVEAAYKSADEGKEVKL